MTRSLVSVHPAAGNAAELPLDRASTCAGTTVTILHATDASTYAGIGLMTKDKSKEAGGKARADSQSPSERKSLATKAAHARWSKRDDVATATHEGTWSGIDCAVLKDGRRVLSERTLSAALGHVRSGSDYARRREQEDGAKLPVFVTDSVEPFLSAQARERLGLQGLCPSDPVFRVSALARRRLGFEGLDHFALVLE